MKVEEIMMDCLMVMKDIRRLRYEIHASDACGTGSADDTFLLHLLIH